jgi:hypothetical protein
VSSADGMDGGCNTLSRGGFFFLVVGRRRFHAMGVGMERLLGLVRAGD